jgi:REP element-mobilizing transposase RayT
MVYKSREAVLQGDIHSRVCQHIVDNAAKKGYYIDSIDGSTDHLHSLMTLNPVLSVSDQIQLIKGESSYWINKSKLVSGHFGWADDYYAESVSVSQLEKVREYIRNQKEHHKKLSFQEEYDAFLREFGSMFKG